MLFGGVLSIVAQWSIFLRGTTTGHKLASSFQLQGLLSTITSHIGLNLSIVGRYFSV